MEYFVTIVSVLAVVGVFSILYFLIRNEWVFRVRYRMLEKDPARFVRLPPYERMLYNYFWVWSIKRWK